MGGSGAGMVHRLNLVSVTQSVPFMFLPQRTPTFMEQDGIAVPSKRNFSEMLIENSPVRVTIVPGRTPLVGEKKERIGMVTLNRELRKFSFVVISSMV